MKNLLFYLFGMLLCIPFSASAGSNGPSNTGKTSLTGKITAKDDGRPLAGAVVMFPDLGTASVSKSDGTYTINDLPMIKALIKVSLTGYATITETIDLSTVAQKDFALEAKVTEMNEVVVTGTSKATELRRDPVPTTLIDSRYIALNASSNIIETLNKVPGVSTLTTGPNVSKPYIRGLGYNRVLTLFNGVRQEGQQWGDEHGIEVDQFLVDRVEVVKGPASLMYGSDALAGVVNLLPAHAAPIGTIGGSVLGNYQTNNKGIAGSVNIDGNSKGITYGARFSNKLASDYQNKYDGRVFGTKFNEKDLNAYIGVNRSWGYTRLNFSLYDALQEIPDGSRDSTSRKFTEQVSEEDTLRPIVSDAVLGSYDIYVLHQRVQHYRVFSTSNFILGKSRLSTNFGFQQSIRREFNHPAYADIPGLYLILNTFSYDLKYYLPEMHGWETTVGLNGMVQKNDAGKGTEIVIPTYRDLDLGPFAHVKRSFGKVDLSGGLRYDVRTYESDSMFTKPNPATGFDMSTSANPGDSAVVKQFDYYKHTFSGVSASIGMAYNVNDRLTLKANVGRGYRAPNAAEISAKGVHPGTGFEQLGDANFVPEFNLQEDVGVFYGGTHISVSAELFNNNISNYIYNEKLVSVNGGDSLFGQNGEQFPVFKFRQTAARLYGGEFSIDIHPHPLDWLHFENAISFIFAENLGGNGATIGDSTRYLPLIPPLHTNSELRADLRKPLGAFANIFVKLGMQVYAAQDRFFAAYGTETRTPGYTLIDAGLGADVVNKKGTTLFSISILGTNLGDVAYQSNMNRLKYFDDYPVNGTGRSGIYNMGRNISLKLVVPFRLKKEVDLAGK